MKLSPSQFIKRIAPIAMSLFIEGSPILPSLRIAQAAHETGWTIHPWNNLVGLKVGTRGPNAYWKGAYVEKGTWEVYDGVRTDVRASFRAYDTIEDSFRDQDLLFLLPRYDRVRSAQDPNEQAHSLYEGGYATDPQYAAKLINIMRRYDLYQYDEEAKTVLQQIEALQHQVEQLSELIKQVNEANKQLEQRLARLEPKQREDQTIAPWAEDGYDFVTTPRGSEGETISDGTRPEDYMTRQEAWTMLERLSRLLMDDY